MESTSKRILIAVTGLSPQVLTETVYSLAIAPQPWIPTDIKLITTTQGARRAHLSLLSEDPGWFHRLLHDYKLPAIPFAEDDILVLPDINGRPLEDIRTPEDNDCAADFITETLRKLTADPDSSVHVSIAGGRKTMGYYLGYALSLFGRPQDRLSHVLVSDPFESIWEFFYPTPYSRTIETRKGDLADTAAAEVTLAEIPFLRLRDDLPDRVLKGPNGFTRTVAAAQWALSPPKLEIDLVKRCIRAGGQTVHMSPALLAFYSLLARRAIDDLGGVRWDSNGIEEALRNEYSLILDPTASNEWRADEYQGLSMLDEHFNQRKSKINRKLSEALGGKCADPYLIHTEGQRSDKRSVLRLEPDAINYGPLEGENPNT